MARKLATHFGIVAAGALAIALGVSGCSGGGGGFTPAEDVSTLDSGVVANIDAAVESAMQLSQSSEAIVGVWSASGEYLHGYGEATGGARFRAAQVTQPVMCALLLDAVDKGELRLDRNVQTDIPRQTRLDDVTYEQLCTGRSGIIDFKRSLTDVNVNNPTRVWPQQELIAQGMARSPGSWPGLDYHGSDTNSVILGRALAIAQNQPLQEQLDERIFEVAGMPDSYYPRAEDLTVNGETLTATTYPSSGGAPVCDADILQINELSPSMLGPAGATITTATDLKNFYESYFAGTFGGDSASVVTAVEPTANPERDEQGTPVAEAAEPAPGDHLWGFGTEKVGPLYGRSGKITGTISATYHDPESGYTVVVALNNSSAGAGFAKALALEIAALSGLEVPWTAEDQAAVRAEAAVCQGG